MIKELLTVFLLIAIALFVFPYIGMVISTLGVLLLTSLPFVVLVILVVPSLRTRFLSV